MKPRTAPLPGLLILIAAVFIAAPARVEVPGRGPGRAPSDAMASLQFLHQQRSYPESEIPPSGYQRAWEPIAQRVAASRMSATPDQSYPQAEPWQRIGPNNIGGRTIALAVDPRDPQRIWAGAASGGLWKSTTQGDGPAAWTYVDTGFPVLGVNAIGIDTSGTETMYIGTGEVYGKDSSIGGLYIRTTRGSYGIGILKSVDGGATWTKSLDWAYDQRRGVLALEVDPKRTGVVFAGTSEGVYRTMDAGDTWTQVLAQPMAVDLMIHPNAPDTVYASIGNLGIPADAGVWRSVDGGDTWSEIGVGILPDTWSGKTMLDYWAANPNVIYADVADWDAAIYDGDLYRSVDGGETWENLTAGFNYGEIATYQGWFSHFVVVHPADSSMVLSAGVDMWRSTDGGRTFLRRSHWNYWYGGVTDPDGPEGPVDYSHADHHAFARHPSDPDVVFLGNDGGVFVTGDFGESFDARNGGYQTTQFYGGFSVSPFDPTYALGGLQDNSTAVYHGDLSWERTLGGDGGMTGGNPYDREQMVASTQYGRLYRQARDSGGILRWYFVNGEMTGDGSDVAFVAPYAQAAIDHNIGYAGRTRVYRSHDFVNRWYVPGNAGPLDGNPVLSLSVYPQDPNVVWAATVPAALRSHVYRTSSGASYWERVTRNLPDRYPVDIVADRTDAGTAYVVFSGFGTGHLYRTRDRGVSWQNISAGLPDIPSSAVAVDSANPDYLYFGNDFGVWFSPDGGATWDPFSAGMPTAALVMDLVVSPASQTLLAITHGLGAWERPLVSAVEPGSGSGGAGMDEPILRQNWPNPFNGQTRIVYYLPTDGRVRMTLLNIRGQQVRVLVDQDQTAGYKSLILDAAGLASGIYLYRLEAAGRTVTRRLLLVK